MTYFHDHCINDTSEEIRVKICKTVPMENQKDKK